MDNNIVAINRLIDEYRGKIQYYNRLIGETTVDKTRLDEDKPRVVSKMHELGFTSRAAIDAAIAELGAKQTVHLSAAKMRHADLVRRFSVLEGEKTAYAQMLESKIGDISNLNMKIALNTKVVSFLMSLSENVRTKTKERIEDIVTKGINKIFSFSPALSFKIEIAIKNNAYSADFMLENAGSKFVSSIIDSYGGGVSDVVGTVLRLCLLEFQVPKNTAPVFLDEVGKFLSSGDYQRNFSQFLKEWSAQFNRQIILITHKSEPVEFADRVISVNKTGNLSIVTSDSK